jgi:hypothetical protein
LRYGIHAWNFSQKEWKPLMRFLLQKIREELKRDMKQRNVTGFAGNGL